MTRLYIAVSRDCLYLKQVLFSYRSSDNSPFPKFIFILYFPTNLHKIHHSRDIVERAHGVEQMKPSRSFALPRLTGPNQDFVNVVAARSVEFLTAREGAAAAVSRVAAVF